MYILVLYHFTILRLIPTTSAKHDLYTDTVNKF